MSNQYLLALDQGTTSSRAILFNKKGQIVTSSQQEFPQIYPRPGWVEHDPLVIWQSQIETAREAIQQSGNEEIVVAGIGITNQRETTVVWDRTTGIPVYNAIVWQDRRTSAYCDELKAGEWADTISYKTGLVIDSYFSATKLRWILTQVEGAMEKARAGELAFGTIDSWLIWKLTNGKQHITDVSNASRTMLYNIRTLSWDDELLDLFGIPREILPEVKSSSEIYAYSSKEWFGVEIPISGIAGDQQAATFGQMCMDVGSVKNTYGTGCFMLCNTGSKVVRSKNNLVSTIAWQINGATTYALEGSIFTGGAIVQWLRDELGIIKTSAEIEELAGRVNDNGGVYLVPALTGLGAPHWDQYARGTILGLTRGSNSAHIARAALESIAFQTYDVLGAMEADLGASVKELRVDGGAVVNNLLMQFQADVIGVPVFRPEVLETTALGAAYLAGLAVGFWKDVDEIKQQWAIDRCFNRKMEPGLVRKLLNGWEKALERAMNWAREEEQSSLLN
ncbi:glycerol kinase GlpK [Gaoshiqia sp. Z1-71]|uniref:glycerol kinase GlpK n=1 Tax=Gaoshiqia hydrogeniformans TaxID=3290090 RepID=UPI003BF8B766